MRLLSGVPVPFFLPAAAMGCIAVALSTLLTGGCNQGALQQQAQAPSAKPAPRTSVPVLSPPRYRMAPFGRWIERSADGTDRVITGGSRMEIRETQVLHATSEEEALENGAALPPWSPSTYRYLFWRDRDLFAAQTFSGPLTKIASLRADITTAFDWTDGVGLLTGDGVLRFAASTSTIEEFPLAGAVSALAVDQNQGIVFTSFAHAHLTQDGGKTFRDVSKELGDATALEVRNNLLTVTLSGARRRTIQPSGEIIERMGEGGQKRGARPPTFNDHWPPAQIRHPLDDLGETAIPLENGEVLVVAEQTVGYLNPSTGQLNRSVEIEQATGKCAPLALPDHTLLLCADKERATVIQLGTQPRVERTFDLVDAPELDRFTAADGEALGFVGPCKGNPKPEFDVDVVANATPYNTSPSRSSVFCVRKSESEWIEHTLNPTDASDIVAWIPRPAGGAVALVARPGTFINDSERIGGKDLLRIVRLARNEPPLALPQYGYRNAELLTRNLHVLPDDSVEGWLPTTNYPSNQVPVVIDPQGRVSTRPLPSLLSGLQTAGPFALSQLEDGSFEESTNWGLTWSPIEDPPTSALQRLGSCSPAGCRIGPVIRIGWASGTSPKISPSSKPSPAAPTVTLRSIRERSYRRPPSPPPLVRLQCTPTSNADGARLPDSYSFGFTPSAVQRNQVPTRIQGAGALMLPWNGAQFIAGSDAELGWIPFFEPGARVRRATINTNSLGLTDMRYRPYEVRLGFVIGPEGQVETVATGPKDNCIASILDKVGVTMPIGGCAPEASLGVHLDHRILLLSSRYGTHTLSTVDLPRGTGLPALREVAKIAVPMGLSGYTFGVGARNQKPVAIAMDGRGQALLSPIDVATTSFGPEERLAPFRTLTLGNHPSCAPAPDQARVVISFDHEIGLDNSIPGLAASGNFGLATLRWSSTKVCLDALELGVRDERYEADIGYYDPPGTVRKLVAIFGKSPVSSSKSSKNSTGEAGGEKRVPPLPTGEGNAALTLILHGTELRQRLHCTGVQP